VWKEIENTTVWGRYGLRSPAVCLYATHDCNEHFGRQRAGFKRRAQQVFIGKGPQEEAGSWVQGQAEGHTQWVQKGNSTGREKASNVVWEIRQ
jgi:hypothetical protein